MDKVIKHGIQMTASLDPSSQKELRATLETIFSEAGSKLDFNTPQNRASIENLAKAFQSIFAKAGNTSIDFSKIMKLPSDKMFKELGTIASTQFWDAWNAVSGGAKLGGNIEQQISSLVKEREKLLTKQAKLQHDKKKVNYFSELGDLASEDEVRPFSRQEVKQLGKTLDDAALRVQEDFTRAEDALSGMTRGTIEYQRALINAYEAASKLYRMGGYINQHPDKIKDKSILQEYDGGNLNDLTYDLFDNYRKDVRKLESTYYEPELAKVSAQLTDINAKIQQAQNNTDGVINHEAISSDLQSLNEIEAACQRVLNAHGKIGKKGTNIQDALNFDPSKSEKGIQSLYNAYMGLPQDSPWEVQYQALLKYVKLYEYYLNGTNKTHQKKITTPGNDFTKLYEKLQPLAANAEQMLQKVLDTAGNGSVAGADNDNKAQAAAEAKAKANIESAAATEREMLAQEASTKAAKEKAAALKQPQSDGSVAGSILNNPAYAHLLGKVSGEAEEKRIATEASANAAKEELSVVKQTTAEFEKQQKLLLYRRVEGELNPSRISSRSSDALYDKSGKPIIQSALRDGFAGFGDGLYASIFGSASNLIPEVNDGPVSFFEFDASQYKFFINKTIEQAQALKSFLSSLQKFVGAGSILDASQLTNITDLSQDQLFEEAQRIFQNFSMSKSQFNAWIENARRESEMIADMFSKGQVPENRHNFGTRFMQTLGYDGVLNATGNSEYDGNYHGSVIFDPDTDKIQKSIKSFSNANEFAAYLENQALAANNAKQAVDGLNTSLEKKNAIEHSDNNMAQVSEENAETEAIQRQNTALQENINLKHQSDINTVTGVAHTDTTPPVATPTSVSVPVTTVNTAQISAEAQALDLVKSKVAEITAAVNAKTQAFFAEQSAVKRVAQSEAHALSDVEKRIDSTRIALSNISSLLNNIKSGQSNVGAGLSNMTITVNHSGDTDAEQQGSWALDTTAQSIKTSLDGIRSDIGNILSAIGNINVQQPEANSSVALATENTLGAVKAVLDAINGKISTGAKSNTSKSPNDKKTDDKKQTTNKKQTSTDSSKSTKDDSSERIKELGQSYEELGRLRAEAEYAGPNEKRSLEEQIRLLEESIKVKQKGLSVDQKLYDTMALDAYSKKISEINLKLAKQRDQDYRRDQKKIFDEYVADTKKQAGLSNTSSTINKSRNVLADAAIIDNQTPQVTAKVQELHSALERLDEKYRKIQASGGAVTPEDQQELIAQTKNVQQLQASIAQLVEEHHRLNGANSQQIGTSSLGLGASSESYKKAITDAVMASTQGRASIKGFNATTNELTYSLKTGAHEFTTFTAAVDRTNGSIMAVRGNTTKTLGVFASIGKKMKEYSYYFTGSMMVYRAVAWVREGVTAVKEIDAALTELKKVTDETEASYDRFLKTAAKTAEEVGSTIKDVVSSTADWARLGYSLQEATKMATSTQILMNVSEFDDVSKATDTLISAVQAFKYTAEESMDVVDILNTIGNNYAISTADLATSLTKSSGSLVAANGTLEEAVALTATANTIIQDADVVGTALKTVAMRIRGTSVEEMEEEGLETDGVVSQSKLQSKIKSISGVDILTDTGAYKSTYQILSEIADVWEDINDMDQAALLELLAGKRAGSVMSAILQNPQTLKDAFESASEATGSAIAENEKYLNSIQGRLDLFTNSVQNMWNETLDSDFIKFIVDAGTALINLADGIDIFGVKIGNMWTTLALVVATIIKVVNKMTWGEFFTSVGTSITGLNTKLTGLATRYGILNKATTAAATSQNALTAATLESSVANGTLSATQAAHMATTNGLTMSQTALTASEALGILTTNGMAEADAIALVAKLGLDQSIKTLTRDELINALAAQGITDANTQAGIAALFFGGAVEKASFSLKKFLASNSMLLTLAAIAAAIYGIVKLFDSWITTLEESEEKFTELNNALETTESKLNDLKGELKEVQDRMKELNEQETLTFVEEEELDNLRKQNDELERQIGITEQIKKAQQKEVNNQALITAKQYRNANFETGKGKEDYQETGSTIGSVAGGVAGGALLGAKIGTALGTFIPIPVVGNIIGFTLGAAAGALLGGIVGEAVGGAIADHQTQVGEAMDDMIEQRQKLEEEYNKAHAAYAANPMDEDIVEEYEEAEAALAKYDSMMSEHISKLDSYYSQIDLSIYDPVQDKAKIESLRKEMNDFYDQQDRLAIHYGGQNAKSNAINRIFGADAIGGFADARDKIEELKENLREAYATEDELAISKALSELEDFKLENILSPEEVERLRSIGIYLYEAENKFKDVAKAEAEVKDAGLYEVAKDINKITDGLENLKSAFDEIIERGSVTAKTITDLYEEFKAFNETDNGVDAWTKYANAVFSGTSSIEEMTKATEEYAQAYLKYMLAQNELTPATKWTYVIQLQNLGVENAEEYVDDLLQDNMVKELGNKFEIDKDAVKKAYEDTNKDVVGPVQDFNTLDDAQIKELAKEYGLLGDISDETITKMADLYGVEESAIRDIIDALKEKYKIEADIKKIQAEQTNYNIFRDKISALKEDMGGVPSFDPEDWEYVDMEDTYDGSGETYYINPLTGETMDEKTWLEQKAKFDEIEHLVDEYNRLIEEGKAKGWVDDSGNIIDKDYQKIIDDLNGQLEGVIDEINTELTLDIQLKMNLQNKSDLVDDIQNVFDTLVNAQKEYDEEGYISVDTLQTLLQLEPKYLDLLVDEEGNLNLTKDALYNVARARIIDMGIQQQKNILEEATALASEGSSEALREQIEVMQNANENGEDFVDVQMAKVRAILAEKVALGELTQAEADAFVEGTMNQIKAVQAATDIALNNLHNSLSSAGNTAKAETEDTFQKEMDYWENRIAANRSKYEQIQNDIDLIESKGQKADASYYEELMSLDQDRLKLLEGQKAAAQKYLATFAEGSEEWWQAAKILNDIESEIDDVTASTIKLQDAIGELNTYKFDEFGKRIDDLTSKLDTLRTLMAPDGEEDWFSDEGNWTESGVAVLGTYLQDLEFYKQAYKNTEDELAKYKSPYAGNEDYYEKLGIHSEQEYYDKVDTLEDSLYGYAKSISDTEQSVVGMYESQIDAIENWADKAIDAYNDYISSVKEALDAERDLYDFKKKVQNESKNISELERKIASLSGSTNASDIASRRKLEAELFEARESLNDTYYDHAIQSQEEALDAEQQAYEETMNKFVEGLRLSLETATQNMDEFLMGVTSMVTLNAETVLQKYEETNLPLTTELTNPWEEAKKAVGNYSGDALALMNEWTKDGNIFATAGGSIANNLKSPWSAGSSAASAFKTSVATVMQNVVSNIATNVKAASGQLSSLYQQIVDTENRAASSNVSVNSGGSDGYTTTPNSNIKALQEILKNVYMKSITVDGIWGSETSNALKAVQKMLNISQTGLYDAATEQAIKDNLVNRVMNSNKWGYEDDADFYRNYRKKVPAAFHAKGTLGTKRDGFAITDESWIGEEITLAAGKNGQLQYLKKGSAVMPADISANLVEWGKINPDMLNVGATPNINMITNAINKPEIVIDVENFLKVDRVDKDTLPQLEAMMDKKIDTFAKQLNYSIKKFSR